MATGPAHYRKAEELVVESGIYDYGDRREASLFARAQVHATLALAAATALQHEYPDYTRSDDSGWREVAGA